MPAGFNAESNRADHVATLIQPDQTLAVELPEVGLDLFRGLTKLIGNRYHRHRVLAAQQVPERDLPNLFFQRGGRGHLSVPCTYARYLELAVCSSNCPSHTP